MGNRKRRYEDARAHYALRRMGSHGELGNIVITVRLPDGSTRRHRFWEGAPWEALVALVLESEWAKVSQPSAVSFFTGIPPTEVDQEGNVGSNMHGATLSVRERADLDGAFEADLSSTCSQEDRDEEIDEPEEEEAPYHQPEASLARLPSLVQMASRPLRRLASNQGNALTNYAGTNSRTPFTSVQQAADPIVGSGLPQTGEQMLDGEPSTEQLFAMPWPTIPSRCPSGPLPSGLSWGQPRRLRPRTGPEPLRDCCKGAALGCLSAWAVLLCVGCSGLL